jgi:translation initiation factor 4E
MVNENPVISPSMEEKENIKENAIDSNVGSETKDLSTKELATSTNGTKQLPFDPNVKHPLKYAWTLYYDAELSAGKRPSTWGDNIKQVYQFGTVEDFWRLYNNISSPSQLQFGCTYSVFKKGIEPKWEDPSNEKGGKWTAIIGKQKGLLDRMWMWMLLACIGQVLEEDGDAICGAVVNVRRQQDKLCIWMRDSNDKDGVLKVGHALKKALELPESFPLAYQAHFSKGGKANANLYQI